MIRLFTEVAYETTREAAMAAFGKSWAAVKKLGADGNPSAARI
jgi:hypothetical protein